MQKKKQKSYLAQKWGDGDDGVDWYHSYPPCLVALQYLVFLNNHFKAILYIAQDYYPKEPSQGIYNLHNKYVNVIIVTTNQILTDN